MRKRGAALVAGLFGPNGLERDELLLMAALALIARGLWLAWHPAAYLVPGLVILWIALPSRSAFVSPRVEKADKARGDR